MACSFGNIPQFLSTYIGISHVLSTLILESSRRSYPDGFRLPQDAHWLGEAKSQNTQRRILPLLIVEHSPYRMGSLQKRSVRIDCQAPTIPSADKGLARKSCVRESSHHGHGCRVQRLAVAPSVERCLLLPFVSHRSRSLAWLPQLVRSTFLRWAQHADPSSASRSSVLKRLPEYSHSRRSSHRSNCH